MGIKIINIADGYGTSTVPSIVDPTVMATVQITLDATEASTGLVTLPAEAVNPTNSSLFWLGVGQQYGVDYTIADDVLTIMAPLLALVEEGDWLLLNYQ
jgi:hypothetical protein